MAHAKLKFATVKLKLKFFETLVKTGIGHCDNWAHVSVSQSYGVKAGIDRSFSYLTVYAGKIGHSLSVF